MQVPARVPGPGYRAGSKEDFDRLYQATYPRLLHTVYGMLGSPAQAEDCVQDAFVLAFQAWARFRPDRPAEVWLHRIAVNTAISHRRKLRLRELGELVRRLGRPVAVPDPQDLALRDDIVAALSHLPARTAAAFILRHHHGYSNRDVASILHVSERTVGLWLARARGPLARALGDAWAPPPPASIPSRVASGTVTGHGHA